jgi:hypothetical protein
LFLIDSTIERINRTSPSGRLIRSLRAKIAETTPLALITEQGENRNQREKQWILSGFPHGFACRGT